MNYFVFVRKRAGLESSSTGEDAFDKSDRQNLSYLVNKIMFFYERLGSLKADLKALSRKIKNKKHRGSDSEGLFKKRSRTRSSLSIRSRRAISESGQEETKFNDETMLKLRKVESLQLKITRMTSSKEFKLFFGWINNESSRGYFNYI